MTSLRIGLALALGCALVSGALASEYVVDANHPRASDGGPGTEAQPWKTLGKACEAAKAGDTVKVVAGDYGERLEPKNSGTEGARIVFLGVPRWQARIVGIDLKGDWIRVEGFEVTGSKNSIPAATLEGNGLELVGNYFHDIPATVINCEPDKRVLKGLIAYNRICGIEMGPVLFGEDCRIENNDISRLRRRHRDSDYARIWGRNILIRYNHLHNSFSRETTTAHVDCLQNFALAPPHSTSTWTARDIVVERNVCSDFAQGYDAAAHAHDIISHHTFRWNVYYRWNPEANASDLLPAAWGVCAEKNQNGFVVEHNTYVNMMWFGVGLCNGSDDGNVRGNIVTGAKSMGYRGGDSKNCTFEDNLYSGPGRIGSAGKGCITADPMFADPGKGNFRLKPGSPCIGAGPDGSTMGALEYPNVYWVDARHPGAGDDGFGYAGAPFKTLEKACAVAQSGETIVLRGGVHRGLLRPANGVVVRAAQDEKPVVSGADLVEGWTQRGGKWVAPLAARPVKVLRDGQSFTALGYDEKAREISLEGFDPRLHVIENVVREHAVDLRERKDVKVEGVDTASTLGAAVVGP